MIEAADAQQPLLQISGLTVTFSTGRGPVEAVRAADLTVRRGETVAVVGESGSGKSTLASAINRLLAENGRVTAGSVVFDDTDLLALPEREMSDVRGRRIGLVPQDPMSNLNPLLPVGKQIAEVFRIHGVAKGGEARERAIRLLEMVGIPDPAQRFRQYPHEFSGGMRQRVLIAMGLACRPQLLIADEPTSALDVTVQKLILDRLEELTASMGTAVLLVTHDLALAAERAHRVVVMHRGEIVESGPASAVLSNPRHEYTHRLLGSAPGLATESLVGADEAPDDEQPAPIIEAVGVRKQYAVRFGLLGRSKPLVAVDDVSFAVPRGRTVGIVGESGSGKSTAAKMLLMLETSTSGEIRFDGRKVSGATGRDLFAFRRRVQPVFQNPFAALDPRFTVGATVREPLEVHKIGTRDEQDARVADLLSQVALDPDLAGRYPHELSGGQRQRVAIARALTLDPEVVILDEAVSALDVLVQAQILDLLVELQRRLGLSYVFISHDLAVVRILCHQVHVMKRGKIVESGTPSELFDNPQHEYTKELLAAIPTGAADDAIAATTKSTA